MLSEKRKEQAGGRLLDILRSREDFSKAHTVLLYSALHDEVPMHEVLKEWRDKCLLLPVVEGGQMFVRKLKDVESLRKGELGILEPTGENFTSLEKIEIALIPGVAFDSKHHRCGRGKGYYDRFLSNPRLTRLKKIGVCFDFQVVENIPVEEHDHALDNLIVV